METIDLHGLGLAEARARLPEALAEARARGERVIRIIHGQGKHSESFPVLKSFVRRWLEESDFARREVAIVFRGEDGSPYTPPNAGETVVVLRGGANLKEPHGLGSRLIRLSPGSRRKSTRPAARPRACARTGIGSPAAAARGGRQASHLPY